MDLKPLARHYFATFSEKNIKQLKDLFSETVSLRDWEIEARGLANVLEANAKIFKSVNTITVTLTSIYQDGNTVLAELEILIDKKTTLLVLDILEFDPFGKIQAIRAFRGN